MIVYAAEVFGFVVALMHIFMVWRLSVRSAPPPPAGLSVDVLIPTYDEPVDMVRRTLLAALRDGLSAPDLAAGRRQPRRRCATLAESARLPLPGARREHRRQGRQSRTTRSATARADFVAMFDADHAPARDFLTQTLGYFDDPKVAFVQTPQDFYNLDSYQHRARPAAASGMDRAVAVLPRHPARQGLLERGVLLRQLRGAAPQRTRRGQGLRHRHGDRRPADLASGCIARASSSVYHAESLAFGVAPATVVPFIKQRVRWGQGAMQALRSGGHPVRARAHRCRSA